MPYVKHVVWEWIDASDLPFYVGWGIMPIGHRHPAEYMWRERHKEASPLNEYLIANFDNEPRRGKDLTREKMHRNAAIAICRQRRKFLLDIGIDVLTSRPHSTKVGGGHRKLVVGDGVTYTSVREAARETGLTPGGITRRCKSPTIPDWYYIPNPEETK